MNKIKILIALLFVTNFLMGQKIFKAYENENYTKIAKLLEKGTDPDILDKNNVTLLFKAAGDNNLEIVKLLIKNGAELDSLNGSGRITPFFSACASNAYEVADYLLSKGANANYQVTAAGNQTPIRFASKIGSVKLVQLLLNNGARLEDCPNDGITPLIQSVRSNHFKLTKFLIQEGANINHVARDKESALNQALKNKNLDIIKLLIENGAKSNIDIKGKSSKQLASLTGNKEIIKLVANL